MDNCLGIVLRILRINVWISRALSVLMEAGRLRGRLSLLIYFRLIDIGSALKMQKPCLLRNEPFIAKRLKQPNIETRRLKGKHCCEHYKEECFVPYEEYLFRVSLKILFLSVFFFLFFRQLVFRIVFESVYLKHVFCS